jgi:N-acetylglutamate synthase-like GNAT family acetyltransferase
VHVRPAHAVDIQGISSLIDRYAAQGVMLPRTPESIGLALHDYVVAIDARGRVMACGALREYSPSVAEVSAVAVAADAQGRGLGTRIVLAIERLASIRGIDEVFALTLTAGFFEAAGYAVVDRAHYPEKLRRDCRACSRRFSCAEICVQRTLQRGAVAVAA